MKIAQENYNNPWQKYSLEGGIDEQQFVTAIIEAEDKERSRLANELHDSLGQTLTAISLNFAPLKEELSRLTQDGKKRFALGMELLREAMQESRTIAHNLMPLSIRDYGYEEAVENLVVNLRTATGIDFKFYCNESNHNLDPALELALFRITQEALNNSIKHATASQINVQFTKFHDLLLLTIEDDGKGFKVTNCSSGYGLNTMKVRAASVDGTLTIESKPNQGTFISVQIPF